jgi:glycerol-3-phosphate acyltransferase PlsY
MNVWLWALIGFLSGSIPFSILVGRLAGGGDIRQQGDHNPGAANVGRAVGWRWFLVAALLDGFKAAIPIWIARFLGDISGWDIIPVAFAPVIGHAYSPWLRLRGGKAVATTFGVWAGLTLWVGPIVLGFLLSLMSAIVRVSGWAVMLAFGLLGFFLEFSYVPAHPEYRWIWLLNAIVLVLKHLADLRQRPGLRIRLGKQHRQP